MGSISLLQWRKAYMLEFLDNGKLVDCFTFSVPPESEELQFSQRLNETKTFGGSVFDDYGNDTYKITLSGSTINEEKKFIYKGTKKAPQYLTGTKEIFELQKIIKNWADGKASSGFFRKSMTGLSDNRKIMLYDLSKMSVLQIAAGTASRNYWRVFIKDLKIRRDKSKPNTYNYTLEMLGVEDEKSYNGLFGQDFSDAIDAIQNVMDNIQTVVDLTEMSTVALSQIATCCSDVKTKFNELKNRNEGNASLIALTVGDSVDVVNRLMGGDSNSFYNSTKEVLTACKTFSGLNDTNEEKGSKTENTSKFKISFDTNGGSSVSNQTVEYCKTVTKPDNPEKTNYSFDGWYSDEKLKNIYDFSSEVTKSFILYAGWKLAVATVTYNSRNGSRVLPQSVTVGEKTTPPTSPTRKGYVFDKWCSDYDCKNEFDFENTPITTDITLYAAWREVCNVTFNSNGGSEVETQTVSIGDLAVYPMTPVKENYTFAYWCTDEELTQVYDFASPVTQDLTLYACYVQISNTVTFNSMGGSEVESERVVIGGYATKPENPTREGYDFIYWCTDKDCTNEFKFNTTSVNSNITLYAKWTETVLAVIFETDGGSDVHTQSVKYNNKAIFPAIPTKDNCTFEKWCKKVESEVTDEETKETSIVIEYVEFDFSTSIKESLTLYAQWFGGE
jgi:uncharacterized repeat protein (TIGR02543 family)